MNRQIPPYESEASLKEFIQQPYVIRQYTKYNASFANRIKNIPYIRIGKIIRGEYAIIYVDSRRVRDILELLGTSYIELFPLALRTSWKS